MPALGMSRFTQKLAPPGITISKMHAVPPDDIYCQSASSSALLKPNPRYDDASSFGGNSSFKSKRQRTNVMTMEELLAVAQPVMGPEFDPDEHIEDWSDDSSEEELSQRERTDEEMLEELMMSGPPLRRGGDNDANVPLRRTVAAIYMPIRVNCLYG